MQPANEKGGYSKRLWAMAIVALVLSVGLFFNDDLKTVLGKSVSNDVSNQEEGQIFGIMPDPLQPDFLDPALEPITPKKTKKVVIKRIPRISMGMPMPHPYWGKCDKCHLFKGGPKAGSKWISPFGKALEKVSTVKKVGPPILPDSTRPHPAAGRCIKCHDIVIKVPV